MLVGNTGVLRCEIPTYVKEYVAVTSWVRDSTFNIFPTPDSGELSDRSSRQPNYGVYTFICSNVL